MLALIAIAVLAPLLYIPGFVLERAIRGAAITADLLERSFERTLLGVLLCGWLALTLAEIGWFSLWLFLLLLLLACAAALLVARRRGGIVVTPAPLGIVARPIPRGTVLRGIAERGQRRWLLAFAALGVLVVLLVGRPFEVVLGVRDAGVYANTGFAIAHHGGIWQHDSIIAQLGVDRQSSDPALADAAAQAATNFFGNQNADRFLLTGLRASGFFFDRDTMANGAVVPQGFHLFPAWVALLTSLLGMQGGLLATGLMGLLGVWAVGMLGRRLAGPWVGLFAAFLLAINGVQVWFSRYSTTETTAQFLTFAGLWAFAAWQGGWGQEDTETRKHGNTATSQQVALNTQHSTLKTQHFVYALIVGLAFGQWALVRIEFILVVAPFLAFLLYTWLTRRWTRAHSVGGVAMAVLLAQAALHIAFISRGYFFDTLFARLQDKSALIAALTLPFLNANLREIYLTTPRSLINFQAHSPLRLVGEVIALISLIAGFIALRRWQTPLRWFERQAQRWAPLLLTLSALAIVLLGVYAYLIRPQILTPDVLRAAPGCLAPAQLRQPTGSCLALQGYIGAPITPPKNPDILAYWLDSLPKLLRQPKLPVIAEAQAAQPAAIRDTPSLPDQPSQGAVIGGLAVGEQLHLLGKASGGVAYLIRTSRGVTGWADAAVLPVDPTVAAKLPEQPFRILTRIVNPRSATTFSPTNPSEAEKFAIYQASLVRFGWYLSPLGVILALIGLALLVRRANRASWLMLVICGLATYVFLEQAYGTDEATYIYLLRRFVPQAYPLFCLGIAYALVGLWNGRRTTDGGRQPEVRSIVRRLSFIVLTIALISFLTATNLKLYRHTEYAGALTQLGAVAAKFKPNDVLLLRGGAPTWGEFRDVSDNLATPLTYAFDRNALTIKSQIPGKYAAELADYVRRWQAQGRDVYLVLSASGAIGLPGFSAEKVDTMQLSLPEFEQLTDQKPSNVQTLTADYAVYRLQPTTSETAPTTIAPNDYATQVRGFYRPEQFNAVSMAWTNGDAVLRLPWPSTQQPFRVAITLAPGERPAALGPANACLAYRVEQNFYVEQPNAPVFSTPTCATIAPGGSVVTLEIDPRSTAPSATGTVLLQISSKTWIPSRDDAGTTDGRALGVLFGGAVLTK